VCVEGNLCQLLFLQQPGGFKPAKLFSIDRVFRNESLDATHLAGVTLGRKKKSFIWSHFTFLKRYLLAEFHQVEGVVADYNLSLGDLIGLIQEFFRRIGITRLRFKPAFNPYTEPSMEIFGCV
jgi:phenylalanyl-tRNA synthetase alpha chain